MLLLAQHLLTDGKVADPSAAKGEDYLPCWTSTPAAELWANAQSAPITRITATTQRPLRPRNRRHHASHSAPATPETGNSNPSGLHWDMVVDLRQGGLSGINSLRVKTQGGKLRCAKASRGRDDEAGWKDEAGAGQALGGPGGARDGRPAGRAAAGPFFFPVERRPVYPRSRGCTCPSPPTPHMMCHGVFDPQQYVYGLVDIC